MNDFNIHINADLGEGGGFDAEIMSYISSCSIACGGHFGDEESMNVTIQLAKKHQVAVGAHPSFPDPAHFGRKMMTMTKSELTASVFDQVLRFYAVCEINEIAVNHVKLHGALYHYAAQDAAAADAVVEALVALKSRPKIYAPYNSVLHRKAENLFEVLFEAFIDRRYQDDLKLVPRGESHAVIERPEEAWEQLVQLAKTNTVTTRSGQNKLLLANTFCIHGDHAQSVAILQYIHHKMSGMSKLH